MKGERPIRPGEPRPQAPRRILLIGSGGAGKSTLATRIGERTGLPVVHLDALYWRPGWDPTPRPEWRRTVEELAARPAWVMDGNYSNTLDQRLAACDLAVFLDYPRLLCVSRIVRRRLRSLRAPRTDMAPGCPERLTWQFLWWVWDYPRRTRPTVLEKLRAAGSAGTRVEVLRSDDDAERLLRELGRGG